MTRLKKIFAFIAILPFALIVGLVLLSSWQSVLAGALTFAVIILFVWGVDTLIN